MSKKSILRSKEQASSILSNHSLPSLDGLDVDDDSSNDDHDEIYQSNQDVDVSLNLNNSIDDADQGKKKNRIPWDRDPRGDKNGLKFALLTVVHENKFHVEGRYKDNFRQISKMLSQPGSAFEKYRGIEASGAQRKFNQIIREAAKSFELNEEGEFINEQEAVGFEVLALSMIKDMVEKEKQKAFYRQNKYVKPDDNLSSPGNCGPQGTTLLRKRRADMLDMKSTFRKLARQEVELEQPNDNCNDDNEREYISEQHVSLVDYRTHTQAIAALKKKHVNMNTVSDLLQVMGISDAGISAFAEVTQVKMDKPLDRLLRLYEDIALQQDYVPKAKLLMGLDTADALELECFLRPFYGQETEICT
jgi:hypothetical protein